MTLNTDKSYKYAYPYYTDLDYLRNLTELQMIPLKEIKWEEEYKYIHTGLWFVPWITFPKGDAKDVKVFIDNLNEKIMEL